VAEKGRAKGCFVTKALTTALETGSAYYEGGVGRIHYRWWIPEAPRFVVLLAHGFGDHTKRWDRYGTTVALDGGGAVLACDHRGHGLSDGPRAIVADFDGAVDDYLRLFDVAELPAGLPIILAGHSMGGLIATRAAASRKASFAGAAISGARIGGWESAELLLARIDNGDVDPTNGSDHPLLDPNVPLNLDALSRDPEVGTLFVGDELAYKGAFPLETLRASIEMQTELRSLESVISEPILYMHGGADPISPYRPSVDRIMQLCAGDLEVRIFDGARHSIFNEINRDEIYEVLFKFIDRVVS
jgi:alpha-beta hydrolase superfamily lysophospholipase